jgi:hypothetical protein
MAGVAYFGAHQRMKPFEVVMAPRQRSRTSNGEVGGTERCANRVIAAEPLTIE